MRRPLTAFPERIEINPFRPHAVLHPSNSSARAIQIPFRTSGPDYSTEVFKFNPIRRFIW